MLRDMSLAYMFGVKPERAIAYLEEKGMKISFDWHEVLDDAHNRAFTVAKAMKLDILQDLRDGVSKAMDEGLTFRDFQKNLEPTLRAKGWWGYKEVLNKATGELRMAQLGSPRRLEIIYEQNVQSIYSAGRYRSQMDFAKSRPYWMYVAVMDMRTRPTHAAMNGQIFRYDDEIWNSFYPPLDFRCRCRVRALDEEGKINMVQDASGVWNADGSQGRLGSREVKLNDGAVATIATYRTADPVTGKAITVATGAGFNSTPGKPWQPDPAKYDPSIRKLL
jgi:SPP1 gp7 family putative phage head morphogenesis protein